MLRTTAADAMRVQRERAESLLAASMPQSPDLHSRRVASAPSAVSSIDGDYDSGSSDSDWGSRSSDSDSEASRPRVINTGRSHGANGNGNGTNNSNSHPTFHSSNSNNSSSSSSSGNARIARISSPRGSVRGSPRAARLAARDPPRLPRPNHLPVSQGLRPHNHNVVVSPRHQGTPPMFQPGQGSPRHRAVGSPTRMNLPRRVSLDDGHAHAHAHVKQEHEPELIEEAEDEGDDAYEMEEEYSDDESSPEPFVAAPFISRPEHRPRGTGLVYDPRMLGHRVQHGHHPECPERISSIFAQVCVLRSRW